MEEPIMKKLANSVPQTGRVVWIGLRPAPKAPVQSVDKVVATTTDGLAGDRFHSKYSQKRQVTLIQQEHIDTVASIMGKPVDPALLRRNIVVSGINLLALKEGTFRVGTAVLKFTGLCHPCSRMEENLGVGGWNAMRGHGGITAQVVSDGELSVGDAVSFAAG